MKTAVVTGASYGLGAAISTKLIDSGFKVYGISRSEPQITHPNFIWIKADLLKIDGGEEISNQISEGQIDVLVNNAGVCFLKKTLDYTDQDFEKMFSLNFKVHVTITKLLFKKLKDGLIINISSLGDRYPDATWGLYASSKAALNIFFEIMATENKEVKIVNILPSYVETPMQHQIHDNTDFDWSQCMKPENIADAVEAVIQNSKKIETGSRVIIEKKIVDEELYRPEKVWTYSVNEGKLNHLH